MAIYKISNNDFVKLDETTFREVGMKERQDLQRILKDSIDVIAPDTLVIAEEFGEWTESQRRIDLLAIDRDANLVVIELKRTQDGGHMELQSIRYAAMISAMTFGRAVQVYADYLGDGDTSQAEDLILNFLGWDTPSEDDFASDVRIVLASAEFSKELTTSVLWLNEKGLNIRCIRMKPYQSEDGTLVNIDQVIPLPEAEEFQVSVRDKRQQIQRERVSNRDTARRDLTIDGKLYANLPKRRIALEVVSAALTHGADIEEIRAGMPNTKWMVVEGELRGDKFVVAASELKSASGGVFRPRKFFCDDDQLFHQNGQTYALSNQWGRGTQDNVTKLQEKYELDIEIDW
jgi:hypothetical protein